MRRNELKGSDENTSVKTKEFLIKKIISQDLNLKISVIILNKYDLPIDFYNKKREIYNSMCIQLLKYRNCSKIDLVVDKRDRKEKYTIELNSSLNKNLKPCLLKITHEYSHSVSGLQIVDIFANSIFRKFERSDLKLFELFKHKLELIEYDLKNRSNI